ncbi:DNA-processing protein DprA [Thiomicrorhabdus heinhorstiae]|uniref:DNA-protecting protein DprA n=1 Tax=Thiomicrorhabdus heinhorstiae TaxID=2748010 RepID=A0ABS0BXF7_9GAMM|nr:DNA-processing protein DprA [Thiomicrorhabdus heinhorstiae]MBF6057531.1 DNA-protecting protein DprA [Thiomicrorhabdus heinhorstiae]
MDPFSELTGFIRLQLCRTSLKQLLAIKAYFGSVESALEAPQSAWLHASILSEKQLQHLFQDGVETKVEEALCWGEEENQCWIPWESDAYPPVLSEIDDPPILLGARGHIDMLKDPQLAVVGSRHASKQGAMIAEDFSAFLSSQGITITSGLAAGIDTHAHRGGLRGVGKTVAVVATGLDRVYPASNQPLARKIAEQGVMISEQPLGTKPLAQYFPQRNRIISGLSLGTLVVEAALKSGSLITARLALEQGKEVFAIPGSIYNPQAKGCHQLIKQGAKLVESADDILEELSSSLQMGMQASIEYKAPRQSDHSYGEGAENKLLAFIDFEPVGLDELVVVTKKPVSELQSQLLILELSGRIEALSGGRWRRIK